MFRKLFVLFFISSSLFSFSVFAIAEPKLVDVINLYQDSLLSNQSSKPILIMFSVDDCPYCKKIKNDVLLPMISSGDYKDKIIIRHLDTSNNEEFISFNNKKVRAKSFANGYGINFFPTIVLFNGMGDAISGHIVGISNEEFYWHDLDNIINSSIFALNIENF